MDRDIEKKLTVVNLSCIRQHRPLFINLSFSVRAHELLLIEGPNGVGKSSLLRLLAGLSTPASGDIFWQDHSIHQSAVRFSSCIHYLGHMNGLKLGLTVIENLMLASHLAGQPLLNVDTVLADLKLEAHKHKEARQLSAGQKRRVALAKLFLLPKILWLLDEPLTALDVDTQALFLERLEIYLQQGGMAVISSHHPIHLPHLTTHSLKLTAC